MDGGIPKQGLREPTVGNNSANRIDRSARTQGSGFVAMALDDATLLLPQQEVASVESSLELVPSDGKTPVAGHLSFAGAHWPVVCVGGDLEPLTTVPSSRRICLMLRAEERGFGILCDRIQMLDANDLRVRELPACMGMSSSPLMGLAIHAGNVVAVTSTGALGGFLEQWVARGG